MKTMQRGFTLIELMIVVAIVGILAAIALPAYQDYLVRSRVSEPLARLAQAKTSVAEFYASRNSTPTSAVEAGIDTTSTQYIVSADWDQTNNRIVAVMSSKVHTNLLNVPIYLNASYDSINYVISWECAMQSGATSVWKYVPANCRR